MIIRGNEVYVHQYDAPPEYEGELDGKTCPKCRKKTYIADWDSGQGCGTYRGCVNDTCDFNETL